ncbi:MAG TPA: type II secretion system F family protein [Candidatus Nanoarchaeia archaeon]|nr:type II secretion system F family protein [Candidatus Nanoarchaeia archaeon]
MEFKIPFTRTNYLVQKKRSEYFLRFVHPQKKTKIAEYLETTDIPLSREEYISICMKNAAKTFLLFFILSTTLLILFSTSNAILFSLLISTIISLFVYATQRNYPRLFYTHKQKNIERNLLSALQDMTIQLNSGIPIYTIMVNISNANYEELSEEFKKMVKKINAGRPQAEVLEQFGEKSPSLFFRRTLWQLSNGLRAGSDLSVVIKSSLNSLSEEQLIQIQNYGNKLNPLVMFYMLITVILPALATTFLTVISSLINLPKTMTALLFISLMVGVVIIQVLFLGVIKSVRPRLL